jgi:hypothetical protein
MNTMTTQQTFRLLAAVAALEFRPMNDNDYAAFCGADDDAVIFDGRNEALVAVLREGLVDEVYRDEVLVLISGGRVEIHGCDAEGDSFCFAFDIGLDRLF